MDRLVVVGASLAGLRAATAARAAGFTGELDVVGDELHPPYTRPPLSKELLKGEHVAADTHLPPLDDDAVTWRLGTRATGLDLERRELRVADEDPLPYDALIIATGSRARTWDGPGAGLEGLVTLRGLDDALDLRERLLKGPRLVVVGAGFIGSEVAASARTLGVETTLVDVAPLPMPALGEALGRRCAQLHEEHGVQLRLGTGLKGFADDGFGRLAAVELADGSRIEADLAVVALGAIANTEWLQGSGLQLEPGVVTDDQLAAVGAQDVWVAGDAAAWPSTLAPGAPVRIEHWTNAAEQGTLAGRNAVVAPEERRAHTSVPSFWSDQYDVKIQAVGLPRLAETVRMAEATPDGGRFVAVGERDGRVIAAFAFNGARRLPFYRRQVAEGAQADAVLAAAAEDPKAFGPPPAEAIA